MEDRKSLEARFGPDPKDWPPPFAAAAEAGDTPRLAALLMAEGDEAALSRAVLTRLAAPRTGLLPGFLPARVALPAFAALWLGVAVMGYQMMGAYADPALLIAGGEVPAWGLLR